MNDFLFVYGTLMNNIQSTIANYLHNNSEFVGEGFFYGKLHDLGSYPGAVYDAKATSRVYGHIFRLNNVSAIFKKLDVYESIDVIKPETNEYSRIVIPVNIKNGIFNCWVYVYNFSTEGLPEIIDGNYLNYFEKNQLHRDFIKRN